ncbi:MAG: hypothetical protein A2V66_15955 [Ignavibacteria bacterium RBG_13_36_8]|nr:MAG: hypothetical protein A2V66_15955 [Ignavibacteria bacterium RBG_13_36_8]
MYLQSGNVKTVFLAITLLFSILFIGCSDEIVPEAYSPSDAHAAYKYSLEQANLLETALGKDWVTASQNVLLEPVEIDLPFLEAFYIDSTSAFAAAYTFDVLHGQKVDVQIEINSRKSLRLFIDLFRVTEDTTNPFVHVASADENKNRLEFEPRRNAKYIIRLQPELLRGGRCSIIIRKMASIEFPVPDRNESSIQSFFGDPRDGGRRAHHGVDIFAPRHTPVIAPASGYVRFVGNRGIGGNVVWLYDSKRFLHYYFAHLQTQTVERYENVEAGDTLGTVGNTGNAKTTLPHLHFGIYIQGRGPVNPYYFITKTDTIPDGITANLNLIGKWVKTINSSSVLLSSNTGENEILLNRNLVMRVMAASRGMYRVHLPTGEEGYVSARQVESTEKLQEHRVAYSNYIVKDNPFGNAQLVEEISSGDDYYVLGEFNGHWFIKNGRNKTGWVKKSEENSLRTSF